MRKPPPESVIKPNWVREIKELTELLWATSLMTISLSATNHRKRNLSSVPLPVELQQSHRSLLHPCLVLPVSAAVSHREDVAERDVLTPTGHSISHSMSYWPEDQIPKKRDYKLSPGAAAIISSSTSDVVAVIACCSLNHAVEEKALMSAWREINITYKGTKMQKSLFSQQSFINIV